MRTGKGTARPISFWEEEIKKWQESGLTKSGYCKKHDLSTTTFCKYVYELGNNKAGSEFIPVKIEQNRMAEKEKGAYLTIIFETGKKIIIEERDGLEKLGEMLRYFKPNVKHN